MKSVSFLAVWFLSAIAVNFFFQPGHVYSSGATGLAQILSVLSQRFIGFYDSRSLTFYAINIPLMIVAWYQIGINLPSLPLLRFR